jgi:hypothetical protein
MSASDVPQAHSNGRPSRAERNRRFKLENTLIPALAALLGALIGGIVTIILTIFQINANQTQAADTFLRSQRQATYATLLTDANELRYDWFYYQKNRALTLANDINSLITKLGSDYSQVALVGPSDVANESYTVFIDASQMGATEHLGINTLGSSSSSAAVQYSTSFVDDLATLNHKMSQVIEGN